MSQLRSVILGVVALVVTGAASVSQPDGSRDGADAKTRNPVPHDAVFRAQVPGFGFVRVVGSDWDEQIDDESGSDPDELRVQVEASGVLDGPVAMLAVSGGGAEGAFGAGLLRGWTESGSRPEFWYVSGVSTGALIAPFAFLGPEYDEVLERVYTTVRTSDLIEERGPMAMLTSDAAAGTEGLRALIAECIDEDLLDAIAREHERGRRLFIGTTNLDLMQPVYWSIGHIAASGHPESLGLVRDVLLASASVPAAFPPVYIEVEVDGQRYDEMHVDGGTASQVFAYPGMFDLRKRMQEVGYDTRGWRMYVIRNSRLEPARSHVPPRFAPIAERAVSALVRSQGVGDLYQIYLITRRDKIEFNLAMIPDSFDRAARELFDPEYMRDLYAVGREMARGGVPWRATPPTYVEE